MSSTHSTSWSVNRSHLAPAAQLLASLYPGLISIRIKEKDYYNRGRVSIRISVKARSAAIGRKVHANIYAHHLEGRHRQDHQPHRRMAGTAEDRTLISRQACTVNPSEGSSRPRAGCF